MPEIRLGARVAALYNAGGRGTALGPGVVVSVDAEWIVVQMAHGEKKYVNPCPDYLSRIDELESRTVQLFTSSWERLEREIQQANS